MDKSNWSLIFEGPKRREKEKREEEEKRRRKEEKKGMELCIDLYGYMFMGCGL